MATYLVPIVAFILLSLYIFLSLRIAWHQIGTQKGPSTSHSERAYKAFEFFFTITIAIVGGIGYLRINVMDNNFALARQFMVLLASFQYLATGFLIIAVISHIGSKWIRWTAPNTKRSIKAEWWRMVEPWMIIFAFIIGTSIWIVANAW